jgi:hypothetical protein
VLQVERGGDDTGCVVGKPETGLGEINGSLHDFPEADFWPASLRARLGVAMSALPELSPGPCGRVGERQPFSVLLQFALKKSNVPATLTRIRPSLRAATVMVMARFSISGISSMNMKFSSSTL